jgi:hypothetical protein
MIFYRQFNNFGDIWRNMWILKELNTGFGNNNS